jgi:NADH:ubiquinone oxidoreductase subunit H
MKCFNAKHIVNIYKFKRNAIITAFIIMLAFIITFILILLAISFFTLAERKLMAAIQRRKGPNVTGL